jgi:hypothetical protein
MIHLFFSELCENEMHEHFFDCRHLLAHSSAVVSSKSSSPLCSLKPVSTENSPRKLMQFCSSSPPSQSFSPSQTNGLKMHLPSWHSNCSLEHVPEPRCEGTVDVGRPLFLKNLDYYFHRDINYEITYPFANGSVLCSSSNSVKCRHTSGSLALSVSLLPNSAQSGTEQ